MKKYSILMLIAAALLLGTLLPGCASIPPAEPIEASFITAKVFFIMPNTGVTVTAGNFFRGPAINVGTQFALWNGDTYLTSIGGREYVALNFPAGTHYFMASGNNWYVVQAELQAGHDYYLEVITLPGFSSPMVRLKYLEPDDPEVAEFLRKSKEITPKGKTSESMIQEARKQLNAAMEEQNIDRIPPL